MVCICRCSFHSELTDMGGLNNKQHSLVYPTATTDRDVLSVPARSRKAYLSQHTGGSLDALSYAPSQRTDVKGECIQETTRSCDCVEASQGLLGVAVPTPYNCCRVQPSPSFYIYPSFDVRWCLLPVSSQPWVWVSPGSSWRKDSQVVNEIVLQFSAG